MRTVTVDDVQLRCDHLLRPGAPALLLINSLGASLEAWDDQLELADRFELIRYDARGHGKSSVGPDSELSVDRLARDALAVLDACGVARAHVCGLSMGGITAMHIATLWPDRVLKLVLANTAPHLGPRDRWDGIIKVALAQGMQALVDQVLERWFTPDFRATQSDRVERVRQMLLATDSRGYAACCAAIRDMDQRESIKCIVAQTLVIGGTKDPSTPPEHSDLIANSIPGARLVMLESAHLSNIERTAQFNAALLEFFGAA